MSRFRIFQLVLLLLLAPPAALAETVDLTDALRAAVAQRPQVAAARQEALAAQAAVTEARSGYLPRLTVQETFQATNEPGGSLFISLNQQRLTLAPTAEPYNHPPDRKDFETRLTLEQALYDPAVSSAVERAQAGSRAAAALADWSTEQAAFAALRAYLEVQQAAAAQSATASSLAEARETLRQADEREAAGLGLRADTLQARVGRAAAERRRLAAEHNLQLARRRLALAMGRESGAVGIARSLAPDDLPLPGDLEQRPRGDLQAARQRAAAAEAASRQARTAYLPRLGLTAAYAWHDPSTPLGTEAGSWQVGAGLSWTLFDGLRRSGGVERTGAEQRAARLRVEELQRQVALQVDEALLAADLAEQQWRLAQSTVAEAEESARLLRQRFEAGLSPLTDLLAAQAALDGARFEQIQARTDMLLARGHVLLEKGSFLHTLLPTKEDQL